ncbi:MAG: DUF1287 domain-containing protein [Marinicaulis sp.]|nr:DUF1287 domain-containing protein [Marinicaulis sp.]NNL90450.1 DUF1287 domain-containing protein [Marinicaulis sp.]
MHRTLVAVSVVIFATPALAQTADFGAAVSAAAIERTEHRVTYDPAYVPLDYPMGDVAADKGVCADVIVRALRKLDIDLQKLVHEDMSAAFNQYPAHWGLSRPDTNIDHRRVPNLEKYFARRGFSLAISDNAADYKPGDIVAWNLNGASGGWLPHIGIVTDRFAPSGRPMIVHNIGAGPKLEDVLFDWSMTGHYRLRAEPLTP